MGLEETLTKWTRPSSDSEGEKQERTERMIREAIGAHAGLSKCQLRVFAKGSYANNTNVRADSDVDIAVECTEAVYREAAESVPLPGLGPYVGMWTPAKLRADLGEALTTRFPGQVDATGTVAYKVHAGSVRVDADVVPCFKYEWHAAPGEVREGTKIFKRGGGSIVNFPAQQLTKGREKNVRTATNYKKVVRILKRIENVLSAEGVQAPLPSYLIECLCYNCPDAIFGGATWTATTEAVIEAILRGTLGDEPSQAGRWVEANECFYLFHDNQEWSRNDCSEFAHAAGARLGFW